MAATSEALLVGARDVSNRPGFTGSWESETSATLLGGGTAVVGYNAGDPRFTSFVNVGGGHEDRVVCRGTSQMSFSGNGNSDGSWTRRRLDVPSGIAVLWGDPAMTTFQNAAFYSMLTIPNDRFDAEVARVGSNGCLRFSDVPGSTFPSGMGSLNALAGACIHRMAFNTGSTGTWNCVRNGNDFFDGGSLTSTSSFVYAAYRNVTRNTVALFRGTHTTGFNPIPFPFNARVDSHVLLKAHGSSVYVALAEGSTIWLHKFNESQNLWTRVQVTTDLNRREVPLKDGRTLGLRGFDIGLLANGGDPDIAIFWQRQVGSTSFTTLRGGICTSALNCSFHTSLQPPNSSNNFMPSIASVTVNKSGQPTTFRHVLSYWSDQSQTNTISMRFAVFTASSFSAQWAGGENMFPCMIKPDYFGHYDASFVSGNGTAQPRVTRLLTDSSGGTCDSRDYRAFPHHVSELPLITF